MGVLGKRRSGYKAGCVSPGEPMAATRHRSADVAATYVRPTIALRNAAHKAATEALAR